MDQAQLRATVEAWGAGDPDPQTARELAQLVEDGQWRELAERFAGSLEFGTAGLRGVLGAGSNRMNRAVVRRTTAGLARYLKAQVPDVTRRGVVVGRDGRRMSREFAQDTAGVLAAEGIPAYVFEDLAPTPLTAFAGLHLGAAAAVMITASHNPPEYNGYKVYWENGAQIIPPHDKGIAAAIDQVEPANQVPTLPEAEARAQGLWREVLPAVPQAYLQAILGERLHRRAEPIRIVYSAMHGVGGRWMKEALAQAGFQEVFVVAAQQEPDGAFPTVRFPNPEEPGAMDLSIALAEAQRADLVLANDPDADRLAVMARAADGRLQMLSGNEIGVLLGHYVLTQKQPRPARPLVVTTIVSSVQLLEIARDLGALCGEVLTGFKWIANHALEREPKDGATFLMGYEEALGYTVGTVVRDKDGIGAGLVFADLAAWCHSRGTTVLGYLEEIQRQHGLFVGKQHNITLPGTEGAATIRAIMENFRARPPAEIGGLRVIGINDYLLGEGRSGGQVRPLTLPPSNVIAFLLQGGSRVTLRPSGTEPKIKYYFELREGVAAGEEMAAARTRASGRLNTLEAQFLLLARQRGQP
ncbi:MAG: phospho-sugar mutase [Myxococcota bacterium]|nr:phospho-sugar mutase [Myxococcota bacterium]